MIGDLEIMVLVEQAFTPLVTQLFQRGATPEQVERALTNWHISSMKVIADMVRESPDLEV